LETGGRQKRYSDATIQDGAFGGCKPWADWEGIPFIKHTYFWR
jgi:hypothetical protein